MIDLKDIPASLMSAVRDVVNSNQNLFQKDLEKRYSVSQPEQSVETPVKTDTNNEE
jgi:hypothetical protein